MGTRDGLARFDGVHFTAQTENLGIRAPWVTFLFNSSDHTLWVGTDGDGVVCVKTGIVTRIRRAQGLANDHVRSICETQDGSIWVGTGAGLTKLKAGSTTTFTTADGLPNDVIRALCEDKEGNLWVGTGDGLVCMRGDRVVGVHKIDPKV